MPQCSEPETLDRAFGYSLQVWVWVFFGFFLYSFTCVSILLASLISTHPFEHSHFCSLFFMFLFGCFALIRVCFIPKAPEMNLSDFF